MSDASEPPRAPDRHGVDRARRRIAGLIDPTPMVPCPDLAEVIGRPVWIKHEQLQRTGSFKVRGAANLLTLLLRSGEADSGVVACSSGNHGRAVAEVAAALGVSATICVPEWVDRTKLRAIEASGAEVRVDGDSYDEAEELALELALARACPFVPPFDHPGIIEGQGSLGLEIVEGLHGAGVGTEALHGVDIVLPLSGGGLAAGCVTAVEDTPVRVVAVSAARAAVMLRSLEGGRPLAGVDERPTLASALSGGIGTPNRWTFPILSNAFEAGRVVLLESEEDAIRRAVRAGALQLHAVVEGGGAVGLSALLFDDLPSLPAKLGDRDGPLVIVLSGGNLDPDLLLAEVEGPASMNS